LIETMVPNAKASDGTPGQFFMGENPPSPLKSGVTSERSHVTAHEDKGDLKSAVQAWIGKGRKARSEKANATSSKEGKS